VIMKNMKRKVAFVAKDFIVPFLSLMGWKSWHLIETCPMMSARYRVSCIP